MEIGRSPGAAEADVTYTPVEELLANVRHTVMHAAITA